MKKMTPEQHKAELTRLRQQLKKLEAYKPEPERSMFSITDNEAHLFDGPSADIRGLIQSKFTTVEDPINDCTNLSPSFMQVRTLGEYENRGFYLGELPDPGWNDIQWVVVTDSHKSQVLVPVPVAHEIKAKRVISKSRR